MEMKRISRPVIGPACAADVKLTVRILNDARRLEDHLVQRRAVTEWQALDVAAVKPIDGAAGIR